MKFNDQFFKPELLPKNPPEKKENPFRCFPVRCRQCGQLRVILIAEFDHHRGEIVVVRRVASKKICLCNPSDRHFNRRF